MQHRFCVFHIEYQRGCKRRFDAEGKEVEANFGESGLVNTGYLNSSYREWSVCTHVRMSVCVSMTCLIVFLYVCSGLYVCLSVCSLQDQR